MKLAAGHTRQAGYRVTFFLLIFLLSSSLGDLVFFPGNSYHYGRFQSAFGTNKIFAERSIKRDEERKETKKESAEKEPDKKKSAERATDKKEPDKKDLEKDFDNDLKRLWEKVKEDDPFKKYEDDKEKKKSLSQKLREKEQRKIRGYWLSPWYDTIWTLGALGYVISMHVVSGNVTASLLSKKNDNYEYSFGNATGGTVGNRAFVSASPYLYMKSSQLFFGSIVLWGNTHPAVSLPMLRITKFSMYHFFFVTFFETVAGFGDLRNFSKESGAPFGLLFVFALFDLFLNILWLSDVYEDAYQDSLYRPEKKVGFLINYNRDGDLTFVSMYRF
jgi:hypothetical protein